MGDYRLEKVTQGGRMGENFTTRVGIENGPTPSISKTSKVFISHSSADRAFVEAEIIPLLKDRSIGTWYSREEITVSCEVQKKIREGLIMCNWFLVVISPNALSSKWVSAEVDWAFENREDRIIPLVYQECNIDELDLRFRQLQHIDFRKITYQAQAKLLNVWDVELR